MQLRALAILVALPALAADPTDSEDRSLLQTGAYSIGDQAEAVDLFNEGGCGRGGEMVMALLPLAWWRRSRSRRRNP